LAFRKGFDKNRTRSQIKTRVIKRMKTRRAVITWIWWIFY